MLVVSDNSALSALAEIGLLELLPKVVGSVTVPASVAREGVAVGAPEALRNFMLNPPEWLTVVPDPPCMLDETRALGAGEAAALTLAWEHRNECTLVLDEKRGRAVARALGLEMIGVLAIVTQASLAGLTDFEDALSKLLATGFRLSAALIANAREKIS